MEMSTVGVDVDRKKDSVVFLFQDPEAFDDFVESGWQSDASATAAPKTRAGPVNGIAIYQITASGLIAKADVAGTRCWTDDKLNESR
jgi:lipid-binding SYLF domain-containing protein